jgi:hypothetical protein
MSYLIAAYGVTLGVLLLYGFSLARERRRLAEPTRASERN